MAEETAGGNATPRTPDAAGLNPGDDAAPGTPGTGEAVCPKCQGSGRVENQACENCGGTGKVIKGLAGG